MASREHFMRNALAHADKSGRLAVSAFVATAFAQDDAEAATAQRRPAPPHQVAQACRLPRRSGDQCALLNDFPRSIAPSCLRPAPTSEIMGVNSSGSHRFRMHDRLQTRRRKQTQGLPANEAAGRPSPIPTLTAGSPTLDICKTRWQAASGEASCTQLQTSGVMRRRHRCISHAKWQRSGSWRCRETPCHEGRRSGWTSSWGCRRLS